MESVLYQMKKLLLFWLVAPNGLNFNKFADNAAYVKLDGGKHPGTYEMKNVSCELAANSEYGWNVVLVDSTAKDFRHIHQLVVGAVDTAEVQTGTPFFRFSVGVGGDPLPPIPDTRYAIVKRIYTGSGSLNIKVSGGRLTGGMKAITYDSLRIETNFACQHFTRTIW
jgi:hypothetical protein